MTVKTSEVNVVVSSLKSNGPAVQMSNGQYLQVSRATADTWLTISRADAIWLSEEIRQLIDEWDTERARWHRNDV